MTLAGVREVHQLAASDCLELLRTANIGRVSVASDANSLGFTVNYALDGESILFRAGRRAKREVPAGATVTFQVDVFDARYQEGWSVTVSGTVDVASDTGARSASTSAATSHLYSSPWMDTGEAAWMRLRPYAVTGRQTKPSAEG